MFGIANGWCTIFSIKEKNENIQKKGEGEFEISYDFEKTSAWPMNYERNHPGDPSIKDLPDVDKIILKNFI